MFLTDSSTPLDKYFVNLHDTPFVEHKGYTFIKVECHLGLQTFALVFPNCITTVVRRRLEVRSKAIAIVDRAWFVMVLLVAIVFHPSHVQIVELLALLNFIDVFMFELALRSIIDR